MEKHLRTISLRQETLDYVLARSSRRLSLAIKITPDLCVTVFAPKRLSQIKIDAFLRQKAHWVFGKIHELKSCGLSPTPRSFHDQSEFLFFGNSYRLHYEPAQNKRVRISLNAQRLNALIPWDMPADEIHRNIKKAMVQWYRKQAHEVLAGKVFQWARTMNIPIDRVCIRTQKTLWGSCHCQNRHIHLNWKLVMAPIFVIDSVIVHELCHLKVPNHSKRFWQTVGTFIEDYQVCAQWLKKNAGLMRLD